MNIKEFNEFIENNKYIDLSMDYKGFPEPLRSNCDCINNFNGFVGVADLFDRQYNLLERIPTQEEYCTEYLKLVKKRFNGSSFYYSKTKTYRNIPYTPEIERVILWRASRAYLSYIMEIQVELIIKDKMPEYGIYNSKELDLAGAVDIMLMNKKDFTLEFIHIAKNGSGIPKKMGKRRVCINGKWVEFNRGNFEGHRLVYYEDATATQVSYIKNGFILFNEEYILKEIRKPIKGLQSFILTGKTTGAYKDRYLYDFCKLLEENIGVYTFVDYSAGNRLTFTNKHYIEHYEKMQENLK